MDQLQTVAEERGGPGVAARHGVGRVGRRHNGGGGPRRHGVGLNFLKEAMSECGWPFSFVRAGTKRNPVQVVQSYIHF